MAGLAPDSRAWQDIGHGRPASGPAQIAHQGIGAKGKDCPKSPTAILIKRGNALRLHFDKELKMEQGRNLVLLAVALMVGCGGPSPASSPQNQGAIDVAQAGIDDSQSVPSPIAPSRVEGDDASPDAGLFRPSFDECVIKAEGVTPDTQACIESEFEFHDARLQLAYRKATQSLDGEALRIAKQEQEAWLAAREKECAWNAMHEGQGQRLDANYCTLRSTAVRAKDLEEMLGNRS